MKRTQDQDRYHEYQSDVDEDTEYSRKQLSQFRHRKQQQPWDIENLYGSHSDYADED